jgi:hypothetical protein
MLISTMNDLPGYVITEVLGEVFGVTVRSRNVGAQLGAGLKSLVGGELKGMTKNLATSRQEVQPLRLADSCPARSYGGERRTRTTYTPALSFTSTAAGGSVSCTYRVTSTRAFPRCRPRRVREGS